MKKRIFAAITAALIFSQTSLPVFAITDSAILLDTVADTYEGNADGTALIRNVNFKDVASDHWAKEAITRMGTMGVIRGDGAGGNYRPNGTVSNEEALAFIVRLLGMDQQALAAGETIKDMYPDGTNSRVLWSLGYLEVAMNQGLITAADLDDAETLDQSQLNPSDAFMRQYPATREQVAEWVSKALLLRNPGGYSLPSEYVRVKNFNDWAQIDVTMIQHVEGLLNNNIMAGVSDSSFSPKGYVTRAQMAQLLKNIDTIYYNAVGYEKKSGTVAAIVDDRSVTTGSGRIARDLYIRTSGGNADIIRLEIDQSTLNTLTYDAVVYNGGNVAGLNSLAEGDEIEYICDMLQNDSGIKRVYYVHKRSGLVQTSVSGKLYAVDPRLNSISLKDDAGRITAYTIAEGLLRKDGDETLLMVDGINAQNINALPYGSTFTLTLANNVVKTVAFVGQETLANEIGGVVLENNPSMGYITIFANDRTKQTKQYYEADMTVKKVEYYSNSDEIGYIAQMFPNFRYNPSETTIDSIEPGDVVFLQLDKSDPNIVTAISASTNYVMRYGKVLQVDTSSYVNSILFEAENKQTSWYDLVDGIAMTKEGKMTNLGNLKPGDWARILVNQAIVEPGYYIESVKAMGVEGDARYITKVVKGQLGAIDQVQKRVSIANYQELTKTGWSNYQEVARFDISGRDTEIYMDGKRISLDYALAYLKRGGAEAYVALENNYGGERVKKITFRTGRDDVLNPDTVVYTAGNGGFLLSNRTGNITSDAGTIVVRYGRLVDANSIMIPDYAAVVVNGTDKAAIVSIDEAADVSAPFIVRGRIQSVDQGKSFTVSSFAALSGAAWSPTPIQRVFTIDYNTKLYNSGGYTDINTFVGYGTASSVNKTYTIITDGSRADWIFDMPYSARAVRGTVYENDGTTVRLRNITVYNPSTGAWVQQGQSITADVTIPGNGAVIKSNKVADIKDVVVGDQLRVMTETLPAKFTSGTAVTGYLVFVER